jgi:hypothetical protein
MPHQTSTGGLVGLLPNSKMMYARFLLAGILASIILFRMIGILLRQLRRFGLVSSPELAEPPEQLVVPCRVEISPSPFHPGGSRR